jgi:Uma2 family endonuclease
VSPGDLVSASAPVDDFPYPPQDLPETDGVPLESDWHRLAIALLIESIRWCWRDRSDYYVGGNMFVYFSAQQVRNRDYRGPDFFFVSGARADVTRETWTVWDEGGRYPDFIIELLSKTTRDEDLTTKKDLYQTTFKAFEYCCYDPATRELLAWRGTGSYEPVPPNDKGWIWIEKMQLWLGVWHGVYHGMEADWPRFYDPKGNILPSRAEEEHQLAEQEKLRADVEKQRADAEKQRADTLDAEVARLKAQLAAKS